MAYDLDTLRRGVESVKANIKAIEKALEQEREKLALYDKEIVKAETLREINNE